VRDLRGNLADRPAEREAGTAARPWLSRAWGEARRFAKAGAEGGLTRMAAALTYYFVLAIFPALIIVAGLLGLIGLSPHNVDALLDAVAAVGPAWAVGFVQAALSSVISGSSGSIALGSGVLLALWTASAYVAAFLWVTEQVENRRPRSFIRQLLTRLILALLLIILLTACAAAIVVSGPFATWLGDLLGLGGPWLTAWSWLKWPILFGVALAMLLLLYHAASPSGTLWRRKIAGATTGVVVVIVASAGFSVYLTHFASYSKVYGALATGIAFLVWAWFANVGVLVGFLVTGIWQRGPRTKTDDASLARQGVERRSRP